MTSSSKRGIGCTIPEKADQVRNRQKRGSRGGRLREFDKIDYRERHTVERGINRLKGTGLWPRDTTSWPSATRRRC
ncbi:hypothetical protein [Streptomyces sp. SA15]|uniref:hypothetical protein n=1 Tax=Streptomyces sp. SA15 TaxID=934019 RepID=UPI0026ABD711